MKLVYSMLLGEYINAESIDYEDCKFFQIVCPACKEPVFKVVRSAEDCPLNYLSHYKSDAAYVSECELRVGAISREEANAANAESRNQFIKDFFSVLRQTIIRTEYTDSSPGRKNTKAFLARLEKAKGLAPIREIAFTHSIEQIQNVPDEELHEYFDSYVEDVTTDGGDFNTQFSMETSKRIGTDIWRHILSPKAKPNYDFIFNHAFVMLISRLETAKATGGLQEWEEFMYIHMVKLIEAKGHKADKLINQLKNYPLDPPYALYPSTIFVKMLSEVTHEMLGCILRLPYLDILKRHKMGELS